MGDAAQLPSAPFSVATNSTLANFNMTGINNDLNVIICALSRNKEDKRPKTARPWAAITEARSWDGTTLLLLSDTNSVEMDIVVLRRRDWRTVSIPILSFEDVRPFVLMQQIRKKENQTRLLKAIEAGGVVIGAAGDVRKALCYSKYGILGYARFNEGDGPYKINFDESHVGVPKLRIVTTCGAPIEYREAIPNDYKGERVLRTIFPLDIESDLPPRSEPQVVFIHDNFRAHVFSDVVQQAFERN